jgi:hypothetical protein
MPRLSLIGPLLAIVSALLYARYHSTSPSRLAMTQLDPEKLTQVGQNEGSCSTDHSVLMDQIIMFGGASTLLSSCEGRADHPEACTGQIRLPRGLGCREGRARPSRMRTRGSCAFLAFSLIGLRAKPADLRRVQRCHQSRILRFALSLFRIVSLD